MSSNTHQRRLEANREWKRRNAEKMREYNKARAALIATTPELLERKLQQNRESAKRHYEERSEYDKARNRAKTNARALIRNRIKR